MQNATVSTVPQHVADCALLIAVGNRAQQIVALSCVMDDPKAADWTVVAVGMGGTRDRGRQGVYRFPDGSAVLLVGDGRLPVEYRG